jgi:glucokinase
MAQDRAPVIGIDLGETRILAAVVDSGGAILGSAKRHTRAEQGPVELIARVTETAREAAADAGLLMAAVAAVGIGIPRPLDPATGIVSYAPNQPARETVPLGRKLADVLGVPVYAEKAVNAMTLGEYVWGAGRGTRDMVGIFVESGVSGGIILDGVLRSGYRHAAGEIGHMVVAAGGPYCGCGRQGCLQAVAGSTAIERALRAGVAAGRDHRLREFAGPDLERLTSGVLAQAWEANCPLTREVIGRAQWYLGLHAASIINLIDPEILVYGGGLFDAIGRQMLAPVCAIAYQHLIHPSGPPVRIVVAELGDNAGVLGAATVARQRHAGA